MKIALVCTEMLPVPPVMGGAIQLYIEGILPIMSKIHDITICSVLKGGLPERSMDDDVRYVRFQGSTKSEYINNVKNYIKDKNFDFIHIFNRPRWVAEISSVAPSTPLSLSLHNEMMIPTKISSDEAIQCIERVSFIATISQFIAEELINMYPSAEEKVYPIYSAVDLERIKPIWTQKVIENKRSMLEKYKLEGYTIILCVSRLNPDKGQHVLIEAIESVFKDYPKVALVLVGSKWYGENEIDEYTKKITAQAEKLECPVIFTGFLTPYEVPDYYNMGDIFVCASQWREPLARIHYEAMAAGLPIITTNRGGNAEVFEDGINGFIIYDYKNPNTMADKIIYLLEHPEKASQMGRLGRVLAEKQFNFNRVADELLVLLERYSKRGRSINGDRE